MKLSERGMGTALGLLRRVARLPVVDRLGLHERIERVAYHTARNGARVAGAASRTFAAASRRLGEPVRQRRTEPPPRFDLTPTDEQQMLQEALGEFAADRLRPAARKADDTREPPADVLAESHRLGIRHLGVPAALGGAGEVRSAVTTVLAAEALAHGDLGLAVACLAPGAVATALALWGDAEQQATYLPALVGDDPPVTALAVAEPSALFDALEPSTTARRDGADLVLDGEKSLVPLAHTAELFLVAAALDGAPALVLVESGTDGIGIVDEPAMGLRAAATGRLVLEDVRVPARALVGDADPEVYAACLHRAWVAWSALAVGTAQAVLDYVIPYVNEREAFGEPISHRQSVAFAVADIGIELEGMRLVTHRAAARADQDRDIARQAAWARRLCAEHGMAIGSHGVQLLGGHGYVKEHPVERWYRDLRAAGLMEGAVLV